MKEDNFIHILISTEFVVNVYFLVSLYKTSIVIEEN